VRPSHRCFAFVLACGATIAPLGDHFHVDRGVTEYLTDFGPLWIGNSPLWFVLVVALSMAGLAVALGHLGTRWDPAQGEPWRPPDPWVFSSPLLVLVLYLTTSFYPWREGGSIEVLIALGAGLLYVGLDRTRTGLVSGLATAVIATSTEWVLTRLGVFRYLPESDELFGVAPWLLPLYFGAAVAVGAVGRRMVPSSRGDPD
jgi:hypothetical protein